MNDSNKGATNSRDTAAECHTRAAADRLRADGMDTGNGRRKFEESAASWDVRGELLGRIEASFEKRERIDAAATHFAATREAEASVKAADLRTSEDDGRD